ncbi:MAG: hypothetical protein N7Q72_03075 [Spiroplasma sp. Tabriz.8]|nr:hypothetical protein [Spiroplasma sp. Tabriz.8]
MIFYYNWDHTNILFIYLFIYLLLLFNILTHHNGFNKTIFFASNSI